MKYEELIIEKREYAFLKQIISLAKYYKDNTYRISIHKLNKEMRTAKILKSKEMPVDVIRLNSYVTIETPNAVTRTFQIVTPEKGDIYHDKISVLAPMGLALFGYAEGDIISWIFPLGESSIKIKKVNQVEPLIMKMNYDSKHSRTS